MYGYHQGSDLKMHKGGGHGERDPPRGGQRTASFLERYRRQELRRTRSQLDQVLHVCQLRR